MDKDYIKSIVRKEIIRKLIEKYGIYYVPVAISNRHVHLSDNHIEKLFGKGYSLKPIRDLSQPGQFVCDEKVAVIGSKGTIEGVRVLGPSRDDTQVEISITDSYKLGIKPMVRMSGELSETPGCKLVGPKGEVCLDKGVIVAARHLHISDEEAGLFGINNGDIVRAKKTGERAVVFDEVVVRSGKGYRLELHIDTDEGNAAGISNGDMLLLERK